MMRARFVVLVLTLLIGVARGVDVPRLEGIAIDGKDADWGDRGFRIDLMTSPSGVVFEPADLAARARVGWDEKGLLLLVSVRDSVREENPANTILGRFDSVEVFVSTAPGTKQRYQYAIAAGAAGGKPREEFTDRREDKAGELKAELASVATDGAYVIEMRLPWANLGRAFKIGDEIGLQVRVNDRDKGTRKSIMWLAKNDSYTNPDSVQRVKLAETPSPPARASGAGEYDRELSHARVRIIGAPELAGTAVEVRAGDRTLKRGTLARDGDASSLAILKIALPLAGKSYPPLDLIVDGAPAAVISLPDLAEAQAKRFIEMDVAFDQAVFSDAAFPNADFVNPLLGEAILGRYEVRKTFYDEQYNVVTSAAKPGRYGAVIEFVPEAKDGSAGVTAPSRRFFRTIVRAPQNTRRYSQGFRARVEEAGGLAWDAQAIEAGGERAGDLFLELLVDANARDTNFPAYMAAMIRPPASTQPWRRNNDARTQDRRWWLGLKRKLNGWDQRWPSAFVCPRPNEGTPATELRVGTPAEAGMTDAGVAAIDEHCKKWAADSDEAFAVCIARHGVVVLHRAYGTRYGRDMTVDTQSWMASITKTISATAMMMLVDQGLVGLDDPADKYLPALAKAKVDRPIRIRNCYTHTSGLFDLAAHSPDALHDWDEAVGAYYPRLKVAQRYEYTTAGIALGSKIVEAISDEALPAFYLKHILQPLKMDHTDVAQSGGDAISTPMDIARFAQMLLNGGAYGNMRFVRPETIEAMMPIQLEKVIGPAEASGISEVGVGVSCYRDSPLGPKTFGHGAASAALLRISPEKDMVVVMTRNAEGKNYNMYEPEFHQLIARAIAK